MAKESTDIDPELRSILGLLPEKARTSQLIQAFAHKLKQPRPVPFDYAGRLVSLANRIAAEVRHIDRLFPEYTPHDADYHINRLFDVADRVIEKHRYAVLNLAELFVLAAGLYAHDWGMAVSDDERASLREWIETKSQPSGVLLLNGEDDRVADFARRIGTDVIAVLDEIPLWREYVRETHAERSAQRARVFFSADGGGVGDAVARVAWAHGVDFQELERPGALPADFSVNACSVDLTALAVYVRIVDVLDLADDRTPFAIWQFVAPRDPRSKMAWAKHRALNPVTCPSYQGSRKIMVDGSTNDPEVWAELRDLGRYVEEQVRGCNDLLARLPDSRCHLDLPVVEWRIHAEGFIPLDLRFEFDRQKTFQILSDEIYEGDCYVFLRELLQNSVDAIRMRKELLERDGTGMQGLIHFEVERISNGDTIVRCRDNGIGMDEYIVRYYLAVAGKSFYASDDFKRFGLQMDAISRFGIGLLSCFMAADAIEIVTLRDPGIAGARQPLRIDIPEVTRNFRVYPAGASTKPGTTVTVHVKRSRLAQSPEGWADQIRVADYLSAVAGFVEFPILVEEGGKFTLILSPVHDEVAIITRLKKTFPSLGSDTLNVQKKGQSYPWDSVFAPQDVSRAQKLLRPEWFDLGDLVDDEDSPYEGRVAVLLPRDQALFWKSDFNWDAEEYRELDFLQREQRPKKETVRWIDAYGRSQRGSEHNKPESIAHDVHAEVHYNGILVSERLPVSDNLFDRTIESLPAPFYTINVKKAARASLNVSRSAVRHGAAPWKTDVDALLHRKILADHNAALRTHEIVDRFKQLGYLRSVYGIGPEITPEFLSLHELPIPWLAHGGSFEFGTFENDLPEQIAIVPDAVRTSAENLLLKYLEPWGQHERQLQDLQFWTGPTCFVQRGKYPNYNENYVESAVDLLAVIIRAEWPIPTLRFLRGWRHDRDILPQAVWSKRPSSASCDNNDLVRRALDSPKELQLAEWAQLFGDDETYPWRMAGIFEPAAQHYFACGSWAVNICHPVAQAIKRLELAIDHAPKAEQLEAATLGTLRDQIQDLWRILAFAPAYQEGDVSRILQQVIEAFNRSGLIDVGDVPHAPTIEDFLPDSVTSEDGVPRLIEAPKYDDPGPARPFGQGIFG